jgi:hypothetical protein
LAIWRNQWSQGCNIVVAAKTTTEQEQVSKSVSKSRKKDDIGGQVSSVPLPMAGSYQPERQLHLQIHRINAVATSVMTTMCTQKRPEKDYVHNPCFCMVLLLLHSPFWYGVVILIFFLCFCCHIISRCNVITLH